LILPTGRSNPVENWGLMSLPVEMERESRLTAVILESQGLPEDRDRIPSGGGVSMLYSPEIANRLRIHSPTQRAPKV
jgi:hypothetical protein